MTEYTRAKLYTQLEKLRTTLEEAVDAGDVPEPHAREMCSTLWSFEQQLTARAAMDEALANIPPEILKLPLSAFFIAPPETN